LFIILPILLIAFILIQAAKRMHDVNKSAWFVLIPFYNIYLLFSPGTSGNNDFGIDPSPVKNVQFFDELESKKPPKEKVIKAVKKNKSNIIIYIIIGVTAFVFVCFLAWYKTVYQPKHSDWDDDGVPNYMDDCKYQRGTFSTNGCPDKDGDGVIDDGDVCPTEYGSQSNGCPSN
jgi:hypothetical protein